MADQRLGKAIFSLDVDSTKFDAGMQKAEGTAEKSTGKLQGAFSKTKAVVGVFGGVVAGVAVGALSDFANAAVEDDLSIASLQQSIENTGAAYGDYADRMDAAIKKGQDLAFSDEQTRAALQMLTEETGSADEALKRLPETMDLARAKHISLEAAAKLLGKVSDENTKALKRMGIVMGEGATAADVLAKVHEIAGGQAEVYGNSTKGSIDKVHDAVREFTEGIGKSLGPAQGFIALMPGIQSGMLLASGAVGGLSGLIKGGMIPSFLASIPATLAMMAPFAPLILIIGGIALAIGLLALAWSNNWGDIRGKTEAAMTFLRDAFDGVRLFILTVWKGIVLGIADAVNGIIGIINGFIDAYNGLAAKLGLPLIGKIELLTPNLGAVDAAIDQIARDRALRIAVTYYPTNSAGGTTGMFASGTDHITRGPELFLAGEAGPERVVVTPLAHGTAGMGGAANGGSIAPGTPVLVRLSLNGRVFAEAMAQAERSGEVSFG